MKHLILSFICLFTFFSCSLNNDYSGPKSYTELLPVSNIIIPEEFELGETYEIILEYNLPTDCHTFNDIYYLSNLNERKVAILTTVINSANCVIQNIPEEVSFNFIATNSGSYIFKFWQGQSSNGEDEYITIEVPVVE